LVLKEYRRFDGCRLGATFSVRFLGPQEHRNRTQNSTNDNLLIIPPLACILRLLFHPASGACFIVMARRGSPMKYAVRLEPSLSEPGRWHGQASLCV